MNRRIFTVLATAFVVAALCSYVVYRLVGGRMIAAAQHRTTEVVVAKTDIKLGSVLKEKLLSMAFDGELSLSHTPPDGSILMYGSLK